MRSAALRLMSIPIQRRSSFSAAKQVVAHPQKGSKTMSPGLLDACMMRLRSATGFLSRIATLFLGSSFYLSYIIDDVVNCASI